MRMGALAAEILFDIIETKETVRPPVRVVGNDLAAVGHGIEVKHPFRRRLLMRQTQYATIKVV